MKGLFLLFVLLGIIWRVIKWYNRPYLRIDRPAPEEAKSAFKHHPTDAVDFLIIATNAFINKGKTLDDVKLILKEKRLNENQIDIVANKAYDMYQKWLNEKSDEEKLAHALKIKNLKEPLPNQEEDEVNSDISITEISKKNHTDSISALTGIKHYPNTRELIHTMLALSKVQAPVMSNNIAAINEISFKDFEGGEQNIYIRTINLKGERQGLFPYLKTDIVIPFETGTIKEWEGKNNYNIEADIGGIAKAALDIGFFATDYAVNKLIYKKQPALNIRLSAFAIVVKNWDLENGGSQVGQNYTGYFPNNNYEGLSYFDFIAKVLSINKVSISTTNHGFIFKLKLLNEIDNTDLLVIDTFVNDDNVKINEIKIDMTIEGLLWLQGEIVE